MNQENNKIVEDSIRPKEEKEFLAREEVRTMEKDLTRLREKEAQRERENVAKIKTIEEMAREKERQAQAIISAREREAAEKEAKDREERVKRLRMEREAKETTLGSEEIKKEESRTEDFRGVLQETQIKEEEERRRFLERVTAKAEGQIESGVSAPRPPAPPSSLPVLPELPQSLVPKPSFSQKLWIRIILALLGITILAGVTTFLYWYFAVRETAPEKPIDNTVETNKPALVIPPSLFYVENSQSIKISQPNEIPFLLFQALQEKINQDFVTRILIEDTQNNKILGLKEFFEVLSTNFPSGLNDKLENDFTLFIYSQEEGNRLGLAVRIKNQEGLAELLASWEGTMENDLGKIFELFGKGLDEPALISHFRSAQYQDTNFRFQTFTRQDLGIVYTIYHDYFILTTSWKSLEEALDRLKEAATSSFFSPGQGAEFVLADMTLKEKIGQLFLIGIDGTALTPEVQKTIENIQPGGILLLKRNIENETQTENLIHDLQQISLSQSGIPLLVGVDQEGGAICTIGFGQEKTSQSEITTAEQAYAVGLNRGEELKNLGINLNLAPVLDTTKSGDFVFDRSFQKDAQESGLFAKALVSGQKEASILTAVKHFPGYGDIAFDPEDKLAVVDSTPEVSLFATVTQAQPEFVMTSNVIYSKVDPNVPFSFSEKGINLLKESVGPEPLIITDDLPQTSLIDKFSLKGVVTLPIQAGVDILTFSNNWGTTLQEAVRLLEEAVRNGEISEARINASVLKIIKLKKVYYHYE